MGAPPLEAGAVHETLAWELPAEAETLVGELGVVTGVTGLVGLEGLPVPTLLVADTVKV